MRLVSVVRRLFRRGAHDRGDSKRQRSGSLVFTHIHALCDCPSVTATSRQRHLFTLHRRQIQRYAYCLRLVLLFFSIGPDDSTARGRDPFNGPFRGLPRSAGTRKGKTNLDFTEARDSEWHWHQLGHMQVCTSLQTDNHDSTPLLSFLQAGCPFCHPTNSVKALKVTG